ncbi:MAG TPA: aspartyl protease family protein [Dyella sp.]|uniref:aspartyl protease family protein n=1 Tax=Dyella sp. TaxID=1869338 RepID=UPI002F91E9B1
MKCLRFCCLILGALLAGRAVADDCKLREYGTLQVNMVGDRATTLVKINGVSTRFILDTGAFFNFMSNANASALGLELEPMPWGYRISGIGGSASVQQTRVKRFGILGTTIDNVAFIVGGTDAGRGLLGANLLDVADLELDLAHGKVVLLKADNCEKASLAYWSKDGRYNVADIEPTREHDRRTFMKVTIHGKELRALLDTGAVSTILGRKAAEKAGIDLNAPTVKVVGNSTGIGEKTLKSWIVNVDSFSVGTETIQHSQMVVIDGKVADDTDMILGVDFVLAHHMFIANSKKKAYFTYNGGRIFTYASAPVDSDKTDIDTKPGEDESKPRTANDYYLLGQAHLSRDETAAALTDFDEAIRMAPDRAGYYAARAKAHEIARQPNEELADLDKALELNPKDATALLMRAQIRFALKDRAGAASDVAAASLLAPAGTILQHAVASFYIRLDRPADALPMLDDWIRLHDDDAMLGHALAERCWARALSNQALNEALKDCKKAIKRDGEKPLSLNGLGLVELRLGNYSDSVKAYQKLVAQQPQSAWSHYSLGVAELRHGDKDAGNADLAAGRTLDPQVEIRANKFGLTTVAQ